MTAALAPISKPSPPPPPPPPNSMSLTGHSVCIRIDARNPMDFSFRKLHHILFTNYQSYCWKISTQYMVIQSGHLAVDQMHLRTFPFCQQIIHTQGRYCTLEVLQCKTCSSSHRKLLFNYSRTSNHHHFYFNRIVTHTNSLPPIDMTLSTISIKNTSGHLWNHFMNKWDPCILAPTTQCVPVLTTTRSQFVHISTHNRTLTSTSYS